MQKLTSSHRSAGYSPQIVGLATLFLFIVATAFASASNPKDLSFTDVKGVTHSRKTLSSKKATVFLFVSAQCPISNVYTPRFLELDRVYSKRNVQVFAVYSDVQESLKEILRHSSDRGYTFPSVKDSQNRIADILGAKATPEAIVTDSSGSVRYRGRFDDNPVATHITSHDLIKALDAVLTGTPVANPETVAVGCSIRREKAPLVAVEGIPTYAKEIAPILRSKCESCHHPGEVAPFSLTTFQQASAWATDIKKYTQNRQMPPWKPTPGYGEFLDEEHINLTDAERSLIAKWVDGGAPSGDLKSAPPATKFVSGWKLGKPDLIIEPAKTFTLKPDGDDVYRHFVIKTNFTEDRFVRAVEVHPGNRQVVHHVIAYIDGQPNQKGEYASENLDGKENDGEPGYVSFGGPGFNPSGILAGWAPGNEGRFLEDGLGVFVPKGARLVLEVHYHKNGKVETDKTQLGVHFCRATVEKNVAADFVLNFGFKIPPGAERHEVRATYQVSTDSHLLGVTPHMHLLGREMKVWAELPDGSVKPLVWIKDWDFNWQNNYYLKQPMALPKGSKIKLLAYYDNSAKNPRNPNRNALKPVGWGEQTTDEMCVTVLGLTKDSEHLHRAPIGEPTKLVESNR